MARIHVILFKNIQRKMSEEKREKTNLYVYATRGTY